MRSQAGTRPLWRGGGWRHGLHWMLQAADTGQGFRQYTVDVDRRRRGAYQG